jgi:ATP-dependent exoDNAse (exonuclease V) beta subunit
MQEKNWNIRTPSEFICTDNHYLIKGIKYARVTRINSVINKPELRAWYAKTGATKAKEILKTRSGFGSTVHKMIEVTLKGEKLSDNYDSFLMDSITIFNKWLGLHKVVAQELEQHLWSEQYHYAGTCDFIGLFDGKLYILDWKTSRGIYDEYWLQMAAYVQAFYELTGLKVEGIGILQIRDGEYNFITKTYDEIMQDYFPVFLAAKTIYDWKYGDSL